MKNWNLSQRGVFNRLNRFVICFQNESSVTLRHVNREIKLPKTFLAAIMVKRCMSVQEVTKNIRLYTEQKRKIVIDPTTLR